MQGRFHDVIVIGAGAAGLIAAMRSAQRGHKTLLLEKNRKAGVKILMSGGTRCNVTHATDNRGIVDAYGPPGRFLHSALAAFSVEDTLAFFHQRGVETKVEETGKIFPVSNKAFDVLNALIDALEQSGAKLLLETPVTDVSQNEAGFGLTTDEGLFTTRKLIVTTGGQSYPGSGTTGDGYRFAEKFGHTIVPPRPALVPITTNEKWIAELRGITIPDVHVLLREGKKKLDQRRGSMLFAHFGLSGPVILDISRHVSGHSNPERLALQLNFLPTQTEEETSQLLQFAAEKAGKKQLAGALTDLLPRRLCESLLEHAGQPKDRLAASLKREDRARIAQSVHRLEIPIQGTMGFGKAEVTAGGVSLKEVDSRTMQSRLVDNLYLAGEVLDLDGPIGGYNFQAAWSTGWLAGESV